MTKSVRYLIQKKMLPRCLMWLLLQSGLLLSGILIPVSLAATTVIVETTLGSFEIELFDEAAPATVANFLNYVNDGAYTDSFIHRSVPGFVIQGGGFTFVSEVVAIPTDAPVVNEPGFSNIRGTVAMAKLGGDPNSATSQWFVNLADNSENLDSQNGGFTVFGEVTGPGMTVVDDIAGLTIWNAGSPFDSIPLIDYISGDIIRKHLVIVENISLGEQPIQPRLNLILIKAAIDAK